MLQLPKTNWTTRSNKPYKTNNDYGADASPLQFFLAMLGFVCYYYPIENKKEFRYEIQRQESGCKNMQG